MAGSTRDIRLGGAYVELTLRSQKLLQGLRTAMGDAQKRLKGFSDLTRSSLSGLAVSGAAYAAPITLALTKYAEFSDQMATVRAVTGATGKEFDALSDTAKQLGLTTTFTASQAAGAMVSLGRAGFTTNEILGSTAGTLSLARAGALDLGEAAEIMANTLRSFGLAASDAARVGDVLTLSANRSNQSVQDIGEAMKYSASFASMAGQSLEQVSAAMAVMANRGVKASVAGTSLGQVFSRLADTSLQEKMKEALGVDAKDAQGNMRSLMAIMRDIESATSGMGSADKLGIMTELFDQRGVKAAATLAGNLVEWRALEGAMLDSAGTAAATAKEMDDSLGGAWRLMMSAVEGLQIAIGEALDKTLRKFMGAVARAASEMALFVESSKELVDYAFRVSAVVVPVTAAFLAAGVAAGALSSAIGTTMAVLAGLATPVGVVGLALAGLVEAFYGVGDAAGEVSAWVNGKFGEIKSFVVGVWRDIAGALAVGDVAAAARIAVAGVKVAFLTGLNELNYIWETLYVTVADVLDRIALAALNAFDSLWTGAKNALDHVFLAFAWVGGKVTEIFWTALREVVESFSWMLDKLATFNYALNLVSDKDMVRLEQFRKGLEEAGAGGAQKKIDAAREEYAQVSAASDQTVRDRNAELYGRMNARADDADAAKDGREAAFTQDLVAAQRELTAATEEYRRATESVTAAAAEDEKALAEQTAAMPRPAPEDGEGGAASDKKPVSESIVTFSLDAAWGMGGNPAEETAKNTKDIVREQRKTNALLKETGVSYSE